MKRGFSSRRCPRRHETSQKIACSSFLEKPEVAWAAEPYFATPHSKEDAVVSGGSQSELALSLGRPSVRRPWSRLVPQQPPRARPQRDDRAPLVEARKGKMEDGGGIRGKLGDVRRNVVPARLRSLDWVRPCGIATLRQWVRCAATEKTRRPQLLLSKIS